MTRPLDSGIWLLARQEPHWPITKSLSELWCSIPDSRFLCEMFLWSMSCCSVKKVQLSNKQNNKLMNRIRCPSHILFDSEPVISQIPVFSFCSIHLFFYFTDTPLPLVLQTTLSNGNFPMEILSRIFQDITPSSTRWLSIQMVYWCQEVKYHPRFVLQSQF